MAEGPKALKEIKKEITLADEVPVLESLYAANAFFFLASLIR